LNTDARAEKCVLIMAGGTGGHIFPALAVADILKARGAAVEWLGTQKGLEARIIPQHHYPISYIEISGLRGKGLITLIVLPFRLLKAMIQTMQVFNKIKPDVVLGMGGFVTGPGGIVAWLQGKPLVLHEQNAIAGMTNRILYYFAKKVLTAFPCVFSSKQESNKLEVIGNPVRKDITEIQMPEERYRNASEIDSESLKILLIGGSLGAAALNKTLPESLNLIVNNHLLNESEFEKIEVNHQCGEKHLDMTLEFYKDLIHKDKLKITVTKFIVDMAEQYRWADIVVCRSGALTVSELAAAGLASILIPYPHAVDDHQTANAKYLSDQNAAILIQQKDLTAENLATSLMSLNNENLQQMAMRAKAMAMNNAAEIAAQYCLNFA
jgi:UDP-N-acetylglucosamine--N-acetylmuramyl-(pentapeptide) pyrophosphoryl-undecaprenol N-acetylglucosamine transferase